MWLLRSLAPRKLPLGGPCNRFFCSAKALVLVDGRQSVDLVRAEVAQKVAARKAAGLEMLAA
eukprot:CAMPEP_0115104128 /NCGR_PEP_ID=MMETSP0227-20121206/35085_1 /TAXON_ID=89957 /ORGANISM="Polarella glacialis, Strain CCMP 1383" /LENGTH=61 /DNA_ID=CAMNT_0002500895 /DNA_START=37 /DNA_END=219 /DNA_ORIENTATION=-